MKAENLYGMLQRLPLVAVLALAAAACGGSPPAAAEERPDAEPVSPRCTAPGTLQAAECPAGTNLSLSFACPRDRTTAPGAYAWPDFASEDASVWCVSHVDTTDTLIVCCPDGAP